MTSILVLTAIEHEFIEASIDECIATQKTEGKRQAWEESTLNNNPAISYGLSCCSAVYNFRGFGLTDVIIALKTLTFLLTLDFINFMYEQSRLTVIELLSLSAGKHEIGR
jgi:hypothetical protein